MDFAYSYCMYLYIQGKILHIRTCISLVSWADIDVSSLDKAIEGLYMRNSSKIHK